jgi:hypothetical protein
MAILGGTVGYRLLRWLSPEGKTTNRDDRAYQQCSKLEALFGPSIWDDLAGKVVIDFGCGTGKLRHLANALSREYLTSFVRCRLRIQSAGSVRQERNLHYPHGIAS